MRLIWQKNLFHIRDFPAAKNDRNQSQFAAKINHPLWGFLSERIHLILYRNNFNRLM